MKDLREIIFHGASVFCIAACLCCGCSESRGPLSVRSDDPTLKIPAIKQDVRRHSTNDLGQMVKDLNDDDPAVRFYAIQGLRRITGDDFGYLYFADEDHRRPGVDRWKEWLKQQP